MPFTFAHPAIVLPFGSFLPRKFSMTGMIAGSIVPDFEYFFRMEVKSLYSHSLPGIFFFDIPVALLMTFLFHYLIRNTLISNLPHFLQYRLSPITKFKWMPYVKNNKSKLLLSIMFGILSHLFWDSFTHQNAFFVTHFNYALTTLDLFHYPVALSKVLQHTSTLLGGLIIFIYLLRMPKSDTVPSTISLEYWLSVACLSLIIIAIRMTGVYPSHPLGMIIVTCLSAFMVSLTIAPLFLTMKRSTLEILRAL
ncbi:DUF4184 family protein [Budvicia diplopodorum]|uniref:DUF4184 family protein n=1 Tax=Budvicia diplopodorum TaxID=1119056 RepID=UPI0013571D37|nr:DUF4184 family protein [Budvicia diplopodorum]